MQNTTTVKKRLALFLKHLNIGQAKFAEIVGVSKGFANNVGDSIRTDNLEKISKSYPELNIAWLLTGEGSMIKGEGYIIEENADCEDGGQFSTGKLIPLFDADAVAGNSHAVDMESARQIEMIQIGGFLRESDAALRVYGNSMIPHYPPGCIVGTRKWTERFIEPGQVYLVETAENRFIKRLMYNRDKTAFRCLSDNTMTFDSGPAVGEFCYPEFEIPIEDVIKIHRVIGVIKRNII